MSKPVLLQKVSSQITPQIPVNPVWKDVNNARQRIPARDVTNIMGTTSKSKILLMDLLNLTNHQPQIPLIPNKLETKMDLGPVKMANPQMMPVLIPHHLHLISPYKLGLANNVTLNA